MRLCADWDEAKYRQFVAECWDELARETGAFPSWLQLTTHTDHPVTRAPAVELHVREQEPLGVRAIEAFKRVFRVAWQG